MLTDKVLSLASSAASLTGISYLGSGANNVIHGQYKEGAKNITEGALRVALTAASVWGLFLIFNQFQQYPEAHQMERLNKNFDVINKICDEMLKSSSPYCENKDYEKVACIIDAIAVPDHALNAALERVQWLHKISSICWVERSCGVNSKRDTMECVRDVFFKKNLREYMLIHGCRRSA